MQKRESKIIFILILILFVLAGFFYHSLSSETVNLADLENREVAGFIIMKTPPENEKQGISVVRPMDGGIQDYIGKWKFIYTQPDEIIIYGFPENEQEDNVQLVTTLKDRGVFVKEVDELPGYINEIIPDHTGTYIMLTGTHHKKEGEPIKLYTCVTQSTVADYNDCHSLQGSIIPEKESTASYRAYWSRETPPRLLVEEFVENEPYYYINNPSDNTSDEVTFEEFRKIIEGTIDVNEENRAHRRSSQRFGPFVMTKNVKEDTTYFNVVKSSSRIYPLPEDFMLIVDENGSMWLHHLPTRRKAHLHDASIDTQFFTYRAL